MLPRSKRVVLKDSEVEEYKNKCLRGHWVLVKESGGDLRKRNDKSLGKDSRRSRNGWSHGRGGALQIAADAKFTAENVAAELDSSSTERFLDVSRRGYLHVDGERFAGAPFDRVSAIVADDNLLRLATFRTFESVQKLSLRRNHLESVEPIADGDLAETLIHLDVSENRLNSDDICRLSTSKLERLSVSANGLSTLPERITDCHCFLSLEFLDLSDNLLRCPETFYVLSTLHGLQTLNLSGNRISFVPYLVTEQSFDGIERINGGEQKYTQGDDISRNGNEDDANELVMVYHVQHIPFVNLNTIDLSNNRIAQSSAVLSLISWPSLTNVTLTANTISLKKNLTKFKNLKSTLSVYNIEIKR